MITIHPDHEQILAHQSPQERLQGVTMQREECEDEVMVDGNVSLFSTITKVHYKDVIYCTGFRRSQTNQGRRELRMTPHKVHAQMHV